MMWKLRIYWTDGTVTIMRFWNTQKLEEFMTKYSTTIIDAELIED